MQLTRVLSVPRETVYTAWTDAALLKQWWGPPDGQTHDGTSSDP